MARRKSLPTVHRFLWRPANGTLALSLDEPGGVGVKSVVTASLYDTPTVTSPLPAVRLPLSPARTATGPICTHSRKLTSNGARSLRACCQAGLNSHRRIIRRVTSETNETWFTVNNFNTELWRVPDKSDGHAGRSHSVRRSSQRQSHDRH